MTHEQAEEIISLLRKINRQLAELLARRDIDDELIGSSAYRKHVEPTTPPPRR